MSYNEKLLEMTAGIVSSTYCRELDISVPAMIGEVYAALEACGRPAQPPVIEAPAKPTPAASVRASIKPNALISMIDGKPYKMLRRHLRNHGYTPETYRAAFDLPATYPMVAADYAATRRALAIKGGLGRKREA